MTKFQKQMLTIAAAGAISAVTALPAMAFENEFHGLFQFRTHLSNYDSGTASQVNPTYRKKTNNYTDQRVRLQYTAKASDDLKLVTMFEIDTLWGNSSAGAFSGAGGRIDTDATNIEVKHVYLDFNVGKSLNMKLGQMAYLDATDGMYINADLPMAYAAFKTGGYTLGLGYSRFNDKSLTTGSTVPGRYLGDYTADLYTIENTIAFSKDANLRFSYYLNSDNTNANFARKINTFALSSKAKFGALDLSGFAGMQAGYLHNGTSRTSYHGWAANALAKIKTGGGTAKLGFLYASGNNTEGSNHNKGWQTLSSDSSFAIQNSYNGGNMMLIVRDLTTAISQSANYMRNPVTNIALAHMGYDAQLTEKFNLDTNIGLAWLPASNYLNGNTAAASGRVNGGDFMGGEVNMQAGYKLYKNLTLKAQAAYFILGPAYKGTSLDSYGNQVTPSSPWTTRLVADYRF